MGSTEGDASIRGQSEIWEMMFKFADPMALKCAVELRIADIIHSHGGGPIALSQIASSFDPPPSDLTFLARLMQFLVHRRVFSIHHSSDSSEAALYGLTQSSRWLLHDSELSLAPMVLAQTHPYLLTPWHSYSQCVKEGGLAFKKAHGLHVWDFTSHNEEFNKIFNDAMACASRNDSSVIFSCYKDGFSGIRTLVDVGGGTGELAARIVKAYPHIKAINFDLPHVIAAAPKHDGVSHIGGDMFDAIPRADAVIMRWILHDWCDEDCVKILKNCRRAIREGTGKLILVEIVLRPDGDNGNNQLLFNETGLVLDLVMSVHTFGKERTEVEWKKILEDAGFRRYKVIRIPALLSIIEAYTY